MKRCCNPYCRRPYCGRDEKKIKLMIKTVNGEKSFYYQCDCGVMGGYGKTPNEAKVKWNERVKI